METSNTLMLFLTPMVLICKDSARPRLGVLLSALCFLWNTSQTIAGVLAFDLPNVALKKPTAQGPQTYSSSDSLKSPGMYESQMAVDGVESTQFFHCTHTIADEVMWWMVDLRASYQIHQVNILNRADFGYRLRNFTVDVFGGDPRAEADFLQTLGQVCRRQTAPVGDGEWAELQCRPAPLIGQFVRIIKWGYEVLTACEVQVLACHAEIEKTYSHTPNKTSLAEPQEYLGVFNSPAQCAITLVHYAQLNGFQFNKQSGNCTGFYTDPEEQVHAEDTDWDSFVQL